MVHFEIRDVLRSMHPPRQEKCMMLTVKARQLDMGKTIWPSKHLHIHGFECKHFVGHSMLAFQSMHVHLLRCRSTGPLGYGIFVDTSQISNKLDIQNIYVSITDTSNLSTAFVIGE